MRNIIIGALKFNDTVATDVNLSDYLTLSGGIITGDVNILSGNYIQTSTPNEVIVYSNNSFVQAEHTKYGNAIAGSKGYYIAGIPSLSCLVLSGDLSGYDVSSDWSIALSNLFESQQVKIVSVDGVSIYLDKELPTYFNAMVGKPESYFKGLIEDNDDNAFYCPIHAEFGNAAIKRFSSNHIEGGSTHAIGQFSHAEGRATIADGRYAHAEGSHGIAGGLASHVEGQETSAIGNHSHAEGQRSKALAEWSHAEGWFTTASSNAAHAEGGETLASGNRSHAEGNLTKAIGAYTHAEGAKTIAGNAELSDITPFSETADGVFAHAEGNGTLAKGNASHAEGYATYAKRQAGHAEGYQTSATAMYSHTEGKMTWADGESTHAEGNQTTAFSLYCHSEGENTYAGASGKKAAHAEGGFTKAINNYAHAEGLSTLAKAMYSHAEGLSSWTDGQASHAEGYATTAFNSYCHAEGQSTYAGRALGATGNCEASHAEGLSTYAVGQASHAEGYQTSAIGLYSHAAGIKSKAKSNYSFAWNGNPKEDYSSNGEGTFCINPAPQGGSTDPLTGVFVGGTSLADKLNGSYQPKGDYTLLTQLYDAVRNLAPDFTTKTYVLNELCTYNGIFYRCKKAIISAASIPPSDDTEHWEVKNVSELFLPLTGGTMTGDLQVRTHAAVGTMDFSTGGNENFGVGHDHKFFGKESFAVHDGNIIGAKGIYWKAIDTTNKKIYLSMSQHCIPSGTALTAIDSIIHAIGAIPNASGWSLNRNTDVPYIGDKNSAAGDAIGLFTAEPDIGLNVAAGTVITIKNYDHWLAYTRCMKVVSVEQGSIINYDYCDQNTSLQQHQEWFLRTIFRRNESTNKSKSPWDSHYVVYFPDKPDIICNNAALVGATSFGCTALGDGNYVGGYNTFAAGFRNNAPGSYSYAIGYENNLSGELNFAFGGGNNVYGLTRSIAVGFGLDTNNDREVAIGKFNKSTKRTSSTDPNATMFSIGNGTGKASSQRANAMEITYGNVIRFDSTPLSNFYIGADNFISCVVKAFSRMTDDQKNAVKVALAIS